MRDRAGFVTSLFRRGGGTKFDPLRFVATAKNWACLTFVTWRKLLRQKRTDRQKNCIDFACRFKYWFVIAVLKLFMYKIQAYIDVGFIVKGMLLSIFLVPYFTVNFDRFRNLSLSFREHNGHVSVLSFVENLWYVRVTAGRWTSKERSRRSSTSFLTTSSRTRCDPPVRPFFHCKRNHTRW